MRHVEPERPAASRSCVLAWTTNMHLKLQSKKFLGSTTDRPEHTQSPVRNVWDMSCSKPRLVCNCVVFFFASAGPKVGPVCSDLSRTLRRFTAGFINNWNPQSCISGNCRDLAIKGSIIHPHQGVRGMCLPYICGFRDGVKFMVNQRMGRRAI